MMTTDYRALCAELAGWIERSTRHYIQDPDVLIRAYAALDAEPEVVEGPTDEEIMGLMSQQMHDDLAAAVRAMAEQEGIDSTPAKGVMRIMLNRHVVDLARAVLARWGHQLAPLAEVGCPACEGVPKPGNQPCAVCGRPAPVPAEGEVAELVAWLRSTRAARLTRAADLLEQRHPAPVAVAERLPGPEDCDAEGRCWWGLEESDDYEACWTLRKMNGIPFDNTRWLPATALPLLQGEVEV